MSTLKAVNLQNPASGIVNTTLNSDGTTTFGGVVTFDAAQVFPNSISSLTAGTGLLGGTITTSATISLDTSYPNGLYLQLAGGTMTGNITFNGAQTFPNVLPLAGGTMTGDITFSGSQTFPGVLPLTGGTVSGNLSVTGSFDASGLNYPTVDGAAGEVLTTDGVGNLSWSAAPAASLQAVTTVGNTTTDSITVAGLTSAGLNYPTVDGSVNQVMKTDGAGNLGWTSLPTETLQTVTDNGSTSTNSITVAGLTAASLIYPLVDGTTNQVLKTDGSGNLGWSTPTVYNLQNVTDNGATSTNSIDVAGLTAAGLIYPAADGAANEVLSTDGAGNLGWLATAEVVAVPGSSAAGGSLGQIAFGTGFFYFFDGTQWLQVAGSTF